MVESYCKRAVDNLLDNFVLEGCKTAGYKRVSQLFHLVFGSGTQEQEGNRSAHQSVFQLWRLENNTTVVGPLTAVASVVRSGNKLLFQSSRKVVRMSSTAIRS